MSSAGASFDLVRAGVENVGQIQALVRAAYEGYVPRIGREPAPMTADYEAVARSGRALMVRLGAEVVGLLVTHVEGEALLIENVTVAPRLQGSGVGSLLLQKAEDLAREAGLSRVQLFTNEAMTENIAFYQRRGFVETGRAEQDGFARVFFAKDLPD